VSFIFVGNKSNYDNSIDINYIKKIPLYTRHNMAHAATSRAKMPFYILWRPDLWRFTETPHMYKTAFIIDVVYKKMPPHTHFTKRLEVILVSISP